MNTLKQLPELTALVEAGKNPFNQVLMNYVDQGGKTVGFMYQDTPEEIITAAGAAPIYLRGTTSEGTEMAEAFFRQLTCNYTKHTYNEILDGNGISWMALSYTTFATTPDESTTTGRPSPAIRLIISCMSQRNAVSSPKISIVKKSIN